MDKETAVERCSLAIKALKRKIKNNPSPELLAVTNEAIMEINKRIESDSESVDGLDSFICTIWQKVFKVIRHEKLSSEVSTRAGEKFDNNAIRYTAPAEKECRWCDHGCFARTPFGCPFKCGEPPHCVGFVWDKKGEIW